MTGIKTADIMFNFISKVASNCEETELEFCEKWKDDRIKELIEQLTPDGILNFTQKLVFELENELITKSLKLNESNNCIDQLNEQIEELKSQYSLLSNEYKWCKEEKDQLLNKIFDEVYINGGQYLGSDEDDVEYKDFKDLQATLAECFDREKVVMWKLERHIALSYDELKYIRSKISD